MSVWVIKKYNQKQFYSGKMSHGDVFLSFNGNNTKLFHRKRDANDMIAKRGLVKCYAARLRVYCDNKDENSTSFSDSYLC